MLNILLLDRTNIGSFNSFSFRALLFRKCQVFRYKRKFWRRIWLRVLQAVHSEHFIVFNLLLHAHFTRLNIYFGWRVYFFKISDSHFWNSLLSTHLRDFNIISMLIRLRSRHRRQILSLVHHLFRSCI